MNLFFEHVENEFWMGSERATSLDGRKIPSDSGHAESMPLTPKLPKAADSETEKTKLTTSARRMCCVIIV